MKIVKDKALVLKTRRPELVTDKIKNCKRVGEKDGFVELALSGNTKKLLLLPR